MSRRRNKLQKVVNSSWIESHAAGPNLFPRSMVPNGSQEYMNTNEDSQGNKGEQTDGQEKNIQDLRVATGDCQHSGHSLSATGAIAKHHQQRLRRSWKVHPKVREIIAAGATFRGQIATKPR